MLPYVEHPVLDLGFYQLKAFPVLVLAGVVVEFRLVLRRAPGQGIGREQASSLIAWAIFWGLLGAHVFDVVFYRPQELLADPWVLLRFWGEISSFGGMVCGLAGLFWAMRRHGLSPAERLRFADCVLFALPFCLALGRAGCALQHDHPGVASHHWLAVAFPDGPRFDLGLLEFLYVAAMAGLFALLDLRRWPPGFYIGLFFTLYGPVRFALDTLRIEDMRYLGWTPAQYLSVLATGLGLAILALLWRGSRR